MQKVQKSKKSLIFISVLIVTALLLSTASFAGGTNIKETYTGANVFYYDGSGYTSIYVTLDGSKTGKLFMDRGYYDSYSGQYYSWSSSYEFPADDFKMNGSTATLSTLIYGQVVKIEWTSDGVSKNKGTNTYTTPEGYKVTYTYSGKYFSGSAEGSVMGYSIPTGNYASFSSSMSFSKF